MIALHSLFLLNYICKLTDNSGGRNHEHNQKKTAYRICLCSLCSTTGRKIRPMLCGQRRKNQIQRMPLQMRTGTKVFQRKMQTMRAFQEAIKTSHGHAKV